MCWLVIGLANRQLVVTRIRGQSNRQKPRGARSMRHHRTAISAVNVEETIDVAEVQQEIGVRR